MPQPLSHKQVGVGMLFECQINNNNSNALVTNKLGGLTNKLELALIFVSNNNNYNYTWVTEKWNY